MTCAVCGELPPCTTIGTHTFTGRRVIAKACWRCAGFCASCQAAPAENSPEDPKDWRCEVCARAQRKRRKVSV